MKNSNKILIFLMTAFLLFSVSIPSMAANVPDLTKRGSIKVNVKDTESKTSVSGGSLTLYQVALAETEDGNYYFQYTENFEDCGFELGDLQSERLADDLADYIVKHQIKGMVTKEISDGTAVFTNLPLGVYLIRQEKAAEKYCALSPFVVTVPMKDGDGYIYQVDASPKAGTVKPEKPTPEKPDHPTTSTPPSKEKTPGGKLPQTGQLWWPIPVLAFSGLLFFAYGWKRRNDA